VAAPPPHTLVAHSTRTPTRDATQPSASVKASEVSQGNLLQHLNVQAQAHHQLLQPTVLLIQLIQMLPLFSLHPAVLLPSPVPPPNIHKQIHKHSEYISKNSKNAQPALKCIDARCHTLLCCVIFLVKYFADAVWSISHSLFFDTDRSCMHHFLVARHYGDVFPNHSLKFSIISSSSEISRVLAWSTNRITSQSGSTLL